jgi:hypothetical protein
MIAREAKNARVAQKIEAAVSNVGKVKLPPAKYKSRAGGAHPLKQGMLLGVILNAMVGCGEGLHEGSLRIFARVARVDLANRFHSETAGFLPALVASHTVGNYREAAFALKFLLSIRLPVEIGILVIFALAAYVGQAGDLNSGFHAHQFDRQICSLSAGCFQGRAAQRETTIWESLR